MLNLSEEWKKAYAEYIKEQDEKIVDDVDDVCNELLEAQNEITRSYELLEQYYELTLNESLEDNSGEGNSPAGSTASNNVPSNKETDVKTLLKDLINMRKNDETGVDYVPSVTFTQERVSDMGFFGGIAFIIKQLGKWIVNVVIYIIEKFKNIIRRLIGKKPVELDARVLIPDFRSVKKIEQISTSVNLGQDKPNGILNAFLVDPSEVSKIGLTEGSDNLNEGELDSIAKALGIIKKDPDGTIGGPDAKTTVRNNSILLTVDLSRDLITLKELIQHFYDLFDNAYGSNNEKLFATDDLKVILDLFKDSIKRVKTGNTATITYRGTAVEINGISKDRVRTNLITTNTNIENLKNAYINTANKIKDISRIINSKEMLMLSSMGVDFRLLTSSTYEQLKSILDTIPNRFKEAAKMEKDLTRMQAQYEKLVKELSNMQRVVQSISNVNFDTVYNRHLIELLNSAKWMSQTVSLRLTGLGLYIRELKEVRDGIAMLVSINKGSFASRKLFSF